jgi:solute carrier family 35, member F5
LQLKGPLTEVMKSHSCACPDNCTYSIGSNLYSVTYINTSSFIVYLIPYAVRRARRRWGGKHMNETGGFVPRNHTFSTRLICQGMACREYEALATDDPQGASLNPPNHPVIEDTTDLPPLTEYETAKLASVFCFYWFLANWTVNASLEYTSVASATILSSMSGQSSLSMSRRKIIDFHH